MEKCVLCHLTTVVIFVIVLVFVLCGILDLCISLSNLFSFSF